MELLPERDVCSVEPAKSSSNTDYEFVAVAYHDSYYKSVKRTFKDIVEKLYGDQTTAIEKIKKSEDRKCLVLVENGSPVAILVYKVEPTSEFSHYNIENSLEVKTFMLMNQDIKNNERYFEKLYSKVVEIAKQMHANAIHVTVSEKVTWTMNFLKKAGFKIYRDWKKQYVQGVNEYMFFTKLGGNSGQKPDGGSETERHCKNEAERGSDFKKHGQDSALSLRPECQGQHKIGERTTESANEPPRKRKYEDEHESESKRQRFDGDSLEKQQNSFRSQRGSYDRREERGETFQGRPSSNSDRGFNYTQGQSMRTGERGEQVPRNDSFNKRVKECTLKKQYIHLIQDGRKTVEGRINSGMFRGFRKDDLVRFFYQQDPQDDVTCKIEEVVQYRSWEEMLTNEGVGCCIPGIRTVADGVRAYDQIPGYKEKAQRNGVLAFRLKVVRSGVSKWRR